VDALGSQNNAPQNLSMFFSIGWWGPLQNTGHLDHYPGRMELVKVKVKSPTEYLHYLHVVGILSKGLTQQLQPASHTGRSRGLIPKPLMLAVASERRLPKNSW
jgi:hypothetical protein